MNVDARQRFAGLAARVAEQRDRAAFGELFDFFAPRLKSFLMRQGQPAQEAEDLAQEVMVILWQKAHLYDPARSSLSTWLFRIARNRRIDAARRQRGPALTAEDHPALVPAQPPAADEILEAADRELAVRKALQVLPQEQLDLVRLAFFQGKSHSEIAEETGLPLGTVKSRIRLAFSRLRAQLEPGVQGRA
ncbi:sigma-70 family RNA polymerase sigma factor [Ensifer soli]|uniref:sigma-70 family RNA polymerase sigma factor n=1 Tax=Ciceribacter sp. sgz301302 TaxID=3342379 RepID=UPI0035B77F78